VRADLHPAPAQAPVDGEMRLPFSHDQRAQAALLADLPDSVAQEAGSFYEAYAAAAKNCLKRDAMADAWKHVIRPYLIGLRDHYKSQERPAPVDGEAVVDARIAKLEEVLGDLLSWFGDRPSDPEWRLKAGEHGADDAVQEARAVLAAAPSARKEP
jgi:hypothetical protein